jgi:hypothetical protein
VVTGIDVTTEDRHVTQRCAGYPDTLISNRARLLAPAAVATAFMLWPRAGATQGTPEAETLLETAVRAMSELESFSFVLTTLEGETRFIEGITLKDVAGSVERPASFTATAEVDLILATLEFTIISIDGRLWFTNPLGDGETFEEIDFGGMGEFDPTVIINPDRLLIPALSTIESPVIAGEETLEDGVMATRVNGTVNLAEVAGVAGTPVSNDLGFSFPESVPFSVWIDADSLVRRIEVTGPILPEEPDGIIRRVDLFGFNEDVDIVAPV